MELKKGQSLILPDKLRKELVMPFGEAVSESELVSRLSAFNGYVISVGDETTLTMIRHGIKPGLAIFDLRTRRTVDVSKSMDAHYPKGEAVLNPPKTITYSLWKAIEKALEDGTRYIRVDGEEDLAALPCAYLARIGSVLVYGLPGIGLDFTIVDESVKHKAGDLLSMMSLKSNVV